MNVTWTPSEFAAERGRLIAGAPPGAPLRDGLVALADRWLTGLLGDAAGAGAGVALVAVGAYGRRDPAPGSDLDLVLLHDGRLPDGLADAIWYPIWDSGVKLDHSVRSLPDALAVADGDLKAVLGLLDARHVAGDPALTAQLRERVHNAWRTRAHRRLPDLLTATDAREASFGELAFLLEGDLKEARGGLRDVQAIRAAAAAWVVHAPDGAVADAHRVLLDVRGELHRGMRRPADRLLLQEQDAVAQRLGLADADALLAAVSGAARTISYRWSQTARQVQRWLDSRKLFRGRPGPRRPLAPGVVAQDDEVLLAADAEPVHDPVLPLRVAAAAAHAGLPIGLHALERLAYCPPLPEPWPATARDAFLALLGAGPALVDVVEALDSVGVMSRLVPEWERVRSLPQRNALHRFTVDRHLVETAAHARAVTQHVDRPDLLLVAAFLHDIGKGRDGDHSEVGAEMVRPIVARMGFPPADVDTVSTLVRHHLLLPVVATRRDLEDPATVRRVAERIPDADTLALLHALTVADGTATGAAGWNDWKAGMVADLARRVRAALTGAPQPPPEPLDDHVVVLADKGEFAVDVQSDGDGWRLTVVAPDRPGLLARYAGVLALHKLDVRAASATSHGAMAVTAFLVTSTYGDPPTWHVVRDDLRRAVDDTLPLAQRLADRERTYGDPRRPATTPWLRISNELSDTATVVEVRTHDSIALLYRLAGALADCGLDVRSAKVASLGAEVVDAFYVVGADGRPLADEADVERLRLSLLAAIG